MRSGNYELTSIDQLKPFNFNFTMNSMLEVALSRGWKVIYSEATPDNSSSGIAHATKNGRKIIFRSNDTILSPIYSYFASENKNLSAALFKNSGVPTPDSKIVPIDVDDDVLDKMLKKIKEIVVKPLNTNHGDGITIGVKNLQECRKAIEFAHKAAPDDKFVLLQKQINHAKEYRFLVLNGKVIAVACRRPPFVIGDGKSTISELIKKLNQDSRRGDGHKSILTKVSLDDVTVTYGKKFLKKVPSINEEVEVLKTSNLSRGGISEDFTDRAGKKLRAIAECAAESCFLGLAGVDIMTRDIENGDETNSWVIETNNAPGLRMHEYPSIGKPRPVTRKIWLALEKRSQSIDNKTEHIGMVKKIRFPELSNDMIRARVDTGATYSTIWAAVKETKQGLEVSFLDGKYKQIFSDFSRRIVKNSTGYTENRYMVKMPVVIKGRKINAKFTLANRSKQIYPVLIGRNVLRNKFIVDVARGGRDVVNERRHRAKKEQEGRN